MCFSYRDRAQPRHAAFARDAHTGHERRPPGPRRVGVHAGEGQRPERRSDRHEQQQHIADTRRLARESPASLVRARVTRGRDGSRYRAVRAACVRPLGHGPVRGHPRVEETVARPTAGRWQRAAAIANAAGGRRGAAVARSAVVSGHGERSATASGARTPIGPDVQAARRPIGQVRLQTAAVADQHGRWPAGATVGRGPAPAAGAAADQVRAGGGRRQEGVVVEVERALLDNTGRLS